MTSERWGTLSVKDHKNTQGLVADLLLYDRLVFPTPPDEAQRERWQAEGWEPELLSSRLQKLGPQAIKAPWNESRRQRLREMFEEQRQISRDAFQTTRVVLALDQTIKLPVGVTHVVAVAAYHSASDFEQDFSVSEELPGDRRQEALVAFLLGQRFVVPDAGPDPEAAVDVAVGLARDSDFQKKRRAYYTWQREKIRQIADEGMVPSAAVDEMAQLVDEYNRCVEKATKARTFRFAFTVAPVILTLVAGAANPELAGASAFISIARFAAMDRNLAVQPGEAEPAAMFYDIGKAFENDRGVSGAVRRWTRRFEH